MRVIPVLDLIAGQVVHAVKGRRHEYKPVRSILSDSSDPLQVAKALLRVTGGDAVYLADLDAIQGQGDNRAVIANLAAKLEAKLWLDCGCNQLEQVPPLLECGVDTIIVGTETLHDPGVVSGMVQAFTSQRIALSLDVARSGLLSRVDSWQGIDPLEAGLAMHGLGVTRFILLSLDAVGSGQGPDLALLRKMRAALPQAEIISGGGVSSAADLRELALCRADGVLAATSLHKGWITAGHIKAAGNGV